MCIKYGNQLIKIVNFQKIYPMLYIGVPIILFLKTLLINLFDAFLGNVFKI